MKHPKPPLLKPAICVHRYYTEQRTRSFSRKASDFARTLQENIERAARMSRMLQRAYGRNWDLAALRLWQDLLWSLEDLKHVIDSANRFKLDIGITPGSDLDDAEELLLPPLLTDIHSELMAAQDEFGEVDFDRNQRHISVITDRIELDGVNLGQFRIELDLDAFSQETPDRWFQVIALDPNTPTDNEAVTHPHISDDRLCGGDGECAIEQALREGRICDFFVLVRSVLQTYNEDSAYVRLEEWDGRSCADCGYISSGDNFSFCEGCEKDYCEECISGCASCDYTLCRGCLVTSQLSRERYCDDCASQCAECGRVAGATELCDDLCETCLSHQPPELAPEVPPETPLADDSTVESDALSTGTEPDEDGVSDEDSVADALALPELDPNQLSTSVQEIQHDEHAQPALIN
jgi:hypothetical protein